VNVVSFSLLLSPAHPCRGLFAASSEVFSSCLSRAEGAAKRLSNSPLVLSGLDRTGVTRSRSVRIPN
jgi:hypothetical protein